MAAKKSGKMQSRNRKSQKRRADFRPLIAIVAILGILLAVLIVRGAPGGSSDEMRVPDITDLHSLVVDPDDPEHVFYGNHSGLYETKDGGKTWTANGSLAGQDAMALAIDGDNLWAAGHDVLYLSRDNGKNFQPVTSRLPGTDIHGLAAAASKPGTLYAYVVGHGLFRTSDGGEIWALVAQKEEAVPGGIMALAVDSKNDNVIYAADMERGLLRSGDGGQSWKTTSLPASSMSLATVPQSTKLFAATDQGIYTSDDGTGSWSQLSTDQASLVAVSAGDPQVIYTVDSQGSLRKSADNGATWK